MLYGCGPIPLLEQGGLAVVGSRHVDEEAVGFTEQVGRISAEAHRTIVSGGAKGIDRAAMLGALSAGGDAVGVLADSLERAALARDYLEPLRAGRLLLISPYDPAAGFNVGHAMQRNKLIYALAEAALVVTSDFEKGGTWAGAVEQLDRCRFVPVFARTGVNVGRGNPALLQRGAKPWPNPQNAEELNLALLAAPATLVTEPMQETLSLQLHEEPVAYTLSQPDASAITSATSTRSAESRIAPSAKLLDAVGEILSVTLTQPATEAEVAEMLEVSKAQAKAWLNHLVRRGVLEQSSRPTRFQTVKASGKLL